MNRKKMRVLLGAVVATIGATAVALHATSGSAEPFSDTDPSTAPIPAYDYGDPDRSFVIEADFGAGSATVTDVGVGIGRSRSHLGDPSLLELRLRDGGGTVLDRIDSWDPRWVFEETAGGERMEIRPGPGLLVTPFDADAESMVVYDVRAGEALTTVDLAPAVREYCLDHPEDAQCVEADLAVTASAVTGAGFSVVGATTPVEVSTTVVNQGPDGPVDATVAESVTAPAGVTVTPTEAEWDADALAVGSPREHTSSYDLTCEQPGLHTVRFASTIEADLAKVGDPDVADNRRTAELQVDCAIPVALDVKPGSDRNPVNVREATIPMAVLTTTAGERGLPVAFDATTIRPESVRIGDRVPLTTSGQGVPERHGKVHLEDVVTRDGDRDAMLHAEGREIPVGGATTELCVRGMTVAGMSFFGCDAIEVVP